MKKVFYHGMKNCFDIEGYYIDSINYDDYFEGESGSLKDFLLGGLNTWNTRKSVRYPEEFHRLFREKHPAYMRFEADFLEKYHDFDIIIMAAEVDLIHPETLEKYFKNKIKILTFIDDPHASYSHGTPYLWAFDGAFYISPSYDTSTLMEDRLQQWGSKHNHWLPLSFSNRSPLSERDDSFFTNREKEIVYIGGYYGPKTDRLVTLKKHFGNRFNIYGRFPYKGYAMAIRGLIGKPFWLQKVPSISDSQRQMIYHSTKIGFNMHLNEIPTETGNARMYEVPYHGLMQITSKAGLDAHIQIFEPNKEAVFYENLDEAIALMEYYLQHDDERVKIAKAGYERVQKDYIWHNNVKLMLDWACSLQ